MTAYNAAYGPLVSPNGSNYQSGASQGYSDGQAAGLHDGQVAIADTEYENGYNSTYDSAYDAEYQVQYNNYYYSGYNDGYNEGESAGEVAAPCYDVTANVQSGAHAQIATNLSSPRLIGVSAKTTGTLNAQER
jgi:flagellar biosynthesis/type III secretory pathway protein FliH